MKSRRRKWVRAGCFLTGFLSAYVAGCYWLAGLYLSPLRASNKIPKGLTQVEIPDVGRTVNPAWCTPRLAVGTPSDVVFVFAHGHGGSLHQFSGLMLDLAGHDIDSVEPSLPGQDDSPQTQVGFGRKEADVLVRTANWVRARAPNAKIVYAGVSMGGSTAWFASEQDPRAAGIVSEAAYASFTEAIRSFFAHAAWGADVYLRPVVWFASARSGLNADQIVPLEAAIKWKGRPALVISDGDDSTIPISHAERLSSASGAPLWVVRGAGHASGYAADPAGYLAHYLTFAKALAISPQTRK